jgi:DNA-binding response OmpR family regulator
MKKRILILIDDLTVSNFYRDKLEACELIVDIAADSNTAVQSFKGTKPDLVVMDPVLKTMDGIELIETFRGICKKTPILIFSRLPRNIVRSAEKAGATQVLIPGETPVDQIIETALGLLGIQDTPLELYTQNTDEFWLTSSISASSESVKSMRLAAYSFAKTRSNQSLLYDLFHQVHHVSGRMEAVGLPAMRKMTSAIEMLVYDLYEMPEQINDSTIRTAIQAVDFLGTLFEPANIVRLSDPSLSVVLAVDDEPGALSTISGAMEMAGLKTSAAMNAEDALGLLRDVDFKLIFLDIGLPGINGFDLCKQTRELPLHQKTPVVFLTGMATFQNRALSTLSGGNDFIGKPFNLFELGVKALAWIFKGQLGMI